MGTPVAYVAPSAFAALYVAGRFAFIDGLVSDPAAGAKVRHASIEAVVDACERAASALGCEAIVVAASASAVVRRAVRRGYTISSPSAVILSKELPPWVSL